jgi:hypothetical protein
VAKHPVTPAPRLVHHPFVPSADAEAALVFDSWIAPASANTAQTRTTHARITSVQWLTPDNNLQVAAANVSISALINRSENLLRSCRTSFQKSFTSREALRFAREICSTRLKVTRA